MQSVNPSFLPQTIKKRTEQNLSEEKKSQKIKSGAVLRRLGIDPFSLAFLRGSLQESCYRNSSTFCVQWCSEIDSAMAQFTEQDFFGGAIRGVVPQGWIDAR